MQVYTLNTNEGIFLQLNEKEKKLTFFHFSGFRSYFTNFPSLYQLHRNCCTATARKEKILTQIESGNYLHRPP